MIDRQLPVTPLLLPVTLTSPTSLRTSRPALVASSLRSSCYSLISSLFPSAPSMASYSSFSFGRPSLSVFPSLPPPFNLSPPRWPMDLNSGSQDDTQVDFVVDSHVPTRVCMPSSRPLQPIHPWETRFDVNDSTRCAAPAMNGESSQLPPSCMQTALATKNVNTDASASNKKKGKRPAGKENSNAAPSSRNTNRLHWDNRVIVCLIECKRAFDLSEKDAGLYKKVQMKDEQWESIAKLCSEKGLQITREQANDEVD